jgi:hypothetical protein
MTTGKSGLQKASVKLLDLPPLTLINDRLGYYAKYRIISEDRNKVSHWSAVYPVTANFDFRRPIDPITNTELPVSSITSFVTNTSSTRVATLSWEPVSAFINNNFITKALGYDVWLKWYSNTVPGGDWIFEERIIATSLSVVRPNSFNVTNPSTGVTTAYAGTNRLEVEIYARQLEPTRSNGPLDPRDQLLLYKSGVITV